MLNLENSNERIIFLICTITGSIFLLAVAYLMIVNPDSILLDQLASLLGTIIKYNSGLAEANHGITQR